MCPNTEKNIVRKIVLLLMLFWMSTIKVIVAAKKKVTKWIDLQDVTRNLPTLRLKIHVVKIHVIYTNLQFFTRSFQNIKSILFGTEININEQRNKFHYPEIQVAICESVVTGKKKDIWFRISCCWEKVEWGQDFGNILYIFKHAKTHRKEHFMLCYANYQKTY